MCCGYMCIVENYNCCVKNLLSCFRVRSRESRIQYYIENNYGNDSDSDSDSDSGSDNFESNLDKELRLKNDSYKSMIYGDNFMFKGKTCSICLEDFEDNNNDTITIIKTNCGHIFHEKCVQHKSITKCPLCRDPFRYKSFINILNI